MQTTDTRFICIPAFDADGAPVDPDIYPLGTDQLDRLAAEALRDADIARTFVWAGDPDGGESVKTNTVLYAAPPDGFKPTHRITYYSRGRQIEVVEVMLVDGVAYDATEYAAESSADWEVWDNGEWRWQGQVCPHGVDRVEVEEIAD